MRPSARSAGASWKSGQTTGRVRTPAGGRVSAGVGGGGAGGTYAVDGQQPQVVHGVHERIQQDAVREGVRAVPLLQLPGRIRIITIRVVVVQPREPAIHGLRDDMARLHPRPRDHRAPRPGGVRPRDRAGALIQLLDIDVEVRGHDEACRRLAWGAGPRGVCARALLRGGAARVRVGGEGGEGARGRDGQVDAAGVAQDVDGRGAPWSVGQ